LDIYMYIHVFMYIYIFIYINTASSLAVMFAQAVSDAQS